MDKCENCRFFLRIEEKQGLCRRYPPQVFLESAQKTVTAFPYMLIEGWCGEFSKAKTIDIQ